MPLSVVNGEKTQPMKNCNATPALDRFKQTQRAGEAGNIGRNLKFPKMEMMLMKCEKVGVGGGVLKTRNPSVDRVRQAFKM